MQPQWFQEASEAKKAKNVKIVLRPQREHDFQGRACSKKRRFGSQISEKNVWEAKSKTRSILEAVLKRKWSQNRRQREPRWMLNRAQMDPKIALKFGMNFGSDFGRVGAQGAMA